MSRLPKQTVVARLKALTPQDFENLAYDLLFLSGMRNLQWRTPGTDGGRDIEGDFFTIDFAGEYTTERWYVECKRYSSSLDWPTVHQKLAVADNHRVDYLLFVTTANFSSPCRDEVERHNKRGGGVRIRIWPFYKIDQLLSIHPQIAIKYGLKSAPALPAVEFDSIITAITKLSQSSYSAAVFGMPVADSVELLASFAELLSARTSDVRNLRAFSRTRFRPNRDSFDWCTPCPLPAEEFDQTTLRAGLACIRAVAGSQTLTCSVNKTVITVENIGGDVLDKLRSSQLFGLIQTYGLVDVDMSNGKVTLTARHADAKR